MDDLAQAILNKLVVILPPKVGEFIVSSIIIAATIYLLWLAITTIISKRTEKKLADSTELSQITQQYITSIGYLNTESTGAIYALEWIAVHNKMSRESIVANFVAYIRETSSEAVGGCTNTAPSSEIKAILTILGRLYLSDEKYRSNSSAPQIDLSDTCLENSNLSNSVFSGDSFVRANLAGSCFSQSVLVNTDFGGANLDRVDFKECNLAGADFVGASLKNANLSGANLKGANLSNADLEGAIFWNSNLEDTNFCNANLKCADLARTKLDKARFFGANLTNTIVNKPCKQSEIDVFEGAKDSDNFTNSSKNTKGIIWIPN